MKLHIVLSDETIRLYGDRNFFSLLAAEATRMAESGFGEYCEFQTIELTEQNSVDDTKPDYRVFRAGNISDFETYEKMDETRFDCVFMSIEDLDFNKHIPITKFEDKP